jgi:hypothetical protein
MIDTLFSRFIDQEIQWREHVSQENKLRGGKSVYAPKARGRAGPGEGVAVNPLFQRTVKGQGAIISGLFLQRRCLI